MARHRPANVGHEAAVCMNCHLELGYMLLQQA